MKRIKNNSPGPGTSLKRAKQGIDLLFRSPAGARLWLVLVLAFPLTLALSCQAQVNTNFTFVTIAGSATNGSADGLWPTAQFSFAKGVAVGPDLHIYVSDTTNDTIREIVSIQTNWMVSTIAGVAGVRGTNDDPFFATSGHLFFPTGIAVDPTGDVFVADTLNNTIRELVPVGSNQWGITTIAGQAGFTGSGDNATNALYAGLNRPWGLALDTNENLYVADSFNQTIRMLSPTNGVWNINTIAGSPGILGTNNGTNLPSLNASFFYPKGIAVNKSGSTIYVADTTNNAIRTVTLTGTNYVVKSFAGLAQSSGSADGTNAIARFFAPDGLAVNSTGTVFVADTGNGTVREITTSGTNHIVTTIGGIAGVTGVQDGAYTNAQFTDLEDICIDRLNNLILDGPEVKAGVVSLIPVGTQNGQPFYEIQLLVGTQTAAYDGAAWTLQNSQDAFGPPKTKIGQTVSAYTLPVTVFPTNLVFSNIVGWVSPGNPTITVSSPLAQITSLVYTSAPPVLTLTMPNGLWINGASNATYEFDWAPGITNTTWTSLGTITLSQAKTNLQIISWLNVTQDSGNVSPAFYRAKWIPN